MIAEDTETGVKRDRRAESPSSAGEEAPYSATSTVREAAEPAEAAAEAAAAKKARLGEPAESMDGTTGEESS
ncbi:hypothetical protein EV177_004558, partial [Coemansia sp. RSA 1804]